MNVNTHQVQYLDAINGRRVDTMGAQNVAFHGTADHNINSDKFDDYKPSRFIWGKDRKRMRRM